MKIYTKTGDKGKTSLFDGTRVGKDNLRVHTYGTIDELNSQIGVVIAFLSDGLLDLSGDLIAVQSDLFELGAYLANPQFDATDKLQTYLHARLETMEQSIDSMTEQLTPMTNFILPGGGKAGALLQVCRTIARRAERSIVSLNKEVTLDPLAIKYLNRLSDYLFTASRFVNAKEEIVETKWEGKIK